MSLQDPQSAELWRAAGSVVGTILGFIVAWPADRKDFVTRLLVSLILGFVSGPGLQDYLKWPDSPRFYLLAAVICSLFAWPIIGAAMRILNNITKLPPKP
jgi:hypothetical protein